MIVFSGPAAADSPCRSRRPSLRPHRARAESASDRAAELQSGDFAFRVARAYALTNLAYDRGEFTARPSDAVATISAPTRRNLRLDSAARSEIADERGPYRIAGVDDVAQEAIDHVLIEDAEIPIFQRVHLQRLQFQAESYPERSAASVCRSQEVRFSDTRK